MLELQTVCSDPINTNHCFRLETVGPDPPSADDYYILYIFTISYIYLPYLIYIYHILYIFDVVGTTIKDLVLGLRSHNRVTSVRIDYSKEGCPRPGNANCNYDSKCQEIASLSIWKYFGRKSPTTTCISNNLIKVSLVKFKSYQDIQQHFIILSLTSNVLSLCRNIDATKISC